MARTFGAPTYVPFDISREAVEAAAPPLLAIVPGLRVRGVIGDFTRDMKALARRASCRNADDDSPRLFALLGSTIGNLDEEEAPALVRSVAEAMDERDAFLLGVDLVKDTRVLHAAYNDVAGVTAEFNRNVLRVVNRELGANFDVASWAHEANYDEERARIEMHLVTERAQSVRIAALDMRVDFEAGEAILTEISRKFTKRTVEQTLEGGGMELAAWYADDAFALAFARPTRAGYSSAAR
jgi:L-histidine N-alpha-methyltransferase